MEDERVTNPLPSSGAVRGRISPPAIHLSPSRQSSSSMEQELGVPKICEGIGTIVAKKKRELFSARSSRSGGSTHSSTSWYSREHSVSSKVSKGFSIQPYIVLLTMLDL